MQPKTLVIFSDSYPNGHSEIFLHNELLLLAPGFENIVIYPQNKGIVRHDLPDNVTVVQPDFSNHTEVRQLLKKHFFSIAGIFLYEIWHSPHRRKYITALHMHLVRLVGYISQVETIKSRLDTYDTQDTVFYSYWFNEWGTRLSLYEKLFNKRFRFLVRVHGYDFDEAQQESGYHLFRAFDLSCADKVVSISDYGKRYIENRYPGYKNKLVVSRLGVTEQALAPVPAMESEDLLIVSCSSLIPLKRVHLIPEILQHLDKPVRWVHFGDGPLSESLKQQITAMPAHIKAEFMGHTDNKTILDFYRNHAVDLFMNVSELEGIPVALMEAVSFGIPVLGCNICGVPEIVNEQTGILTEKDFNPVELSKIIEDAVSKKLRSADFRKGVKAFGDLNFNAEKNYNHFLNSCLLN